MSSHSSNRYPTVEPQPHLPAIERDVLARWEREDTFRRSVEQRDAGVNGDNEFVFYDGPPFANGLPHYGHLLTGYVKDAVPRYQTMRGRRVERRFGWDCHGLPAEVQAEKELGTRFDFRGTGTTIAKSGEAGVTISSETEERASAALDVFKEKLVKRNISLKSLDAGEPRQSGKTYKIDCTVVEGIDNAPRAFLGLLRGENIGKMLVKVGPAED